MIKKHCLLDDYVYIYDLVGIGHWTIAMLLIAQWFFGRVSVVILVLLVMTKWILLHHSLRKKVHAQANNLNQTTSNWKVRKGEKISYILSWISIMTYKTPVFHLLSSQSTVLLSHFATVKCVRLYIGWYICAFINSRRFLVRLHVLLTLTNLQISKATKMSRLTLKSLDVLFCLQFSGNQGSGNVYVAF